MASRRILLLAGAALLAACACAGAVAGTALYCDRDAYVRHATASWTNPNEQYLFACGRVWHSTNRGGTWQPVRAQGLPPLAREGLLAVDRDPGRLYLALTTASASTRACPLCAFTHARPVIYLSQDAGAHWTVVHRFRPGPRATTYVRALYADPDFSQAAWVVVSLDQQVAYWATNTGGLAWQQTCVEFFGGECDPPDEFLRQRQD